MKEHFQILANAIDERSFWQWWSADLPGSIQLEFGQTQLLTSEPSGEGPASTQIALRVSKPASVTFLEFASDLPKNWIQEFHNDNVGPFYFEDHTFCFNSPDHLQALMRESINLTTIHGGPLDLASISVPQFQLGFAAGDVGMVILGGEITLVTELGELQVEEAEELSAKWWAYFHEYKSRQHTKEPLPPDFRCDTTLTSGEMANLVRKGKLDVPPEVRSQLELEIGVRLPGPSLFQRLRRWFGGEKL